MAPKLRHCGRNANGVQVLRGMIAPRIAMTRSANVAAASRQVAMSPPRSIAARKPALKLSPAAVVSTT